MSLFFAKDNFVTLNRREYVWVCIVDVSVGIAQSPPPSGPPSLPAPTNHPPIFEEEGEKVPPPPSSFLLFPPPVGMEKAKKMGSEMEKRESCFCFGRPEREETSSF